MASVKKETFDIADGITEEEALEGTDAATNNFTINVERVAAKVTMTCENTTLTNANNNAGGTITTPKFTLKGGAAKSYRMGRIHLLKLQEMLGLIQVQQRMCM